MSEIISFEIDSDNEVLNGSFLHIKDISFDLAKESDEDSPKYGMKYSYYITDVNGMPVPSIEEHLKTNQGDREYINESVKMYVEDFVQSKVDANVSAVTMN